ncbi:MULTISPECIES: tetratricopeptide repeat protein [unclassified Thermotoga]|uniref:tetratricopeptide repeat protein n=1 Tax=unclassified Thermotoga TaxID=2631113 RepID=UPI000540F7B4|nr:tetratricopeptide repeat protein [Thermotoga sp. TBGT1766]AIY88758.1 hypothetical protein CELL2_07475 [Thermotoga sp. Cell2]KHC92917.1 hypothetical protein TBGT1765_02752 [Thermotoga sp. TBGT1765]KHC95736.1 hypothetical protein XYL54_07576 [Thermotoga sp. Xyl54]
MRIIFILLLLIPSLLTMALSLEEIKSLSKTNLDNAIDLFLDYMKKHPSDPELENVGEFLFAKKKLVEKHPSLSREIISEDFHGLLEKLRDTEEMFSEEEVPLLEEIFPELKSFAEKLQDVEEFLSSPFFWKLGISLKIENPEKFAEDLVNRFLEDPFVFSFEVVEALSKVENAEEIAYHLVRKAKEIPLKEESYSYILRLFEVAHHLGYSETDELEEQIKKYFSISAKVDASGNVEEILDEYEQLTIPKEKLREKLAAVSKKSKVSEEKRGRYYPFFLVFLALPFLSARFRASFYRRIGMKKRAASIYLKLLQKQPENVKLRLKLARLYEEIGMHEEAMKEYEIIKKLS